VTLAQRSVRITTPYFVPDSAFRIALETAALRGVDVQVLLPLRSDNPLVDAAARSYLTDLLRVGARVFAYERGFVHAKTMVIDGAWSSVGSANMDIRSFRLNFEVGALVYDTAFADEMTRLFERDVEHSRELRLSDLEERGTFSRTLEALARLASPIL
jgi:cardiolipin synthase